MPDFSKPLPLTVRSPFDCNDRPGKATSHPTQARPDVVLAERHSQVRLPMSETDIISFEHSGWARKRFGCRAAVFQFYLLPGDLFRKMANSYYRKSGNVAPGSIVLVDARSFNGAIGGVDPFERFVEIRLGQEVGLGGVFPLIAALKLPNDLPLTLQICSLGDGIVRLCRSASALSDISIFSPSRADLSLCLRSLEVATDGGVAKVGYKNTFDDINRIAALDLRRATLEHKLNS